MSGWKTYTSIVLLVMVGVALLIPSTLILATTRLSPYSDDIAITIGAVSGLYMASALMALASTPLLAKRALEGHVMGLASCILGFSTFILLLSITVSGIIKGGHYMYSSKITLLLMTGGLAIVPEFLISMILASDWGKFQTKRGESS